MVGLRFAGEEPIYGLEPFAIQRRKICAGYRTVVRGAGVYPHDQGFPPAGAAVPVLPGRQAHDQQRQQQDRDAHGLESGAAPRWGMTLRLQSAESTRSSASSPSSAQYDTSMGLQQTGQSSTYDCSGTDKSRVRLMVSQQ